MCQKAPSLNDQKVKSTNGQTALKGKGFNRLRCTKRQRDQMCKNYWMAQSPKGYNAPNAMEEVPQSLKVQKESSQGRGLRTRRRKRK